MILVDRDIKSNASQFIEDASVDSHTGKDDQIQASSIDLRIGSILVPDEKEPNGQLKPRSSYAVPQGGTAVIETREWLKLPKNFAAMGFPPARLSGAGLLMTNPGHVDPGYTGRLSFTVINMGKEPYPLAGGMPIVTLLLFKLAAEPEASWEDRGHSKPLKQSWSHEFLRERLSRLSSDFLSVTDRATNVAKEESKRISFWNTVIVAIIAASATVITGLVNYLGVGKSEFDKLGEKVTRLEGRSDVEQLKSRIELLEKSIASPTTSKLTPDSKQKK